MHILENTTFDELQIGQSASVTRTLTKQDTQLLAMVLGETAAADSKNTYRPIAGNGVWGGNLIAAVFNAKLPGPGSQYVDQTLNFLRSIEFGDKLKVTVTVKAKDPQTRMVTFDCECINQHDDLVINGTAHVIAPTQKLRCAATLLPQVSVYEPGKKHLELIERAGKIKGRIKTAIVQATKIEVIQSAIEAYEANLIDPIFIAPKDRLKEEAEIYGISLKGFKCIDVAHSHDAAEVAVKLAREGEVQAITKGAMHTDELMLAVIDKVKGIRTDKRMSHCFVMDTPNYDTPLIITDAAVNIEPDLLCKQHIVQNAIDLAISLDIEVPKVAILAAVETVNPKMQATLDAAALCKMADRKQIVGGILDGPLAFDNAISKTAAISKGIDSPVAGHPDILVVPDIESGNMLAKQLCYLSNAETAGIVIGAKVPISLTSRSDNVLARKTSMALIKLFIHANKA